MDEHTIDRAVLDAISEAAQYGNAASVLEIASAIERTLPDLRIADYEQSLARLVELGAIIHVGHFAGSKCYELREGWDWAGFQD